MTDAFASETGVAPTGSRLYRRLVIGAAAGLMALCIAGCGQPAPERDIPLNGTDAGHRLYVAKCAKCHKFYDPARYSKLEWSKWMTKMTKKARLTPEQSALISNYIEENLRPGQSRRNELK